MEAIVGDLVEANYTSESERDTSFRVPLHGLADGMHLEYTIHCLEFVKRVPQLHGIWTGALLKARCVDQDETPRKLIRATVVEDVRGDFLGVILQVTSTASLSSAGECLNELIVLSTKIKF